MAEDTRTGILGGPRTALTLDGLPVRLERLDRRGRLQRLRVRAGDRVRVRVSGGEAHVLEVLERSSEPLVGQFVRHGRYPHVESLSPDYRGRVSLEDAPGDIVDGASVAVRITGEDRRGLVGEVLHTLAVDGGIEQAATTLLASHRVPQDWPDAVLRADEKLPARIQPGRHGDRADLTALPLVTIDGETARDFDDAVYAEPLGSGKRHGWRLVVAIADVGHYVKAGSALDREAWLRGNSLYLPDRVVPMLPESLSNGLCSLRPREPRLALVADLTLDGKGEIDGYDFYEAVIDSWQRLTYTRAAEFLDSGALDVEPEVQDSLQALAAVYRLRLEARRRRGGLDFDSHEARLELDAAGRVCALHPVLRNDAHRLIEEAMIAANVAAARFLEEASEPALYRIHEAPADAKADDVRQALAFAGLRLPRGAITPRALYAALDELGDRPDRWLFDMLVLRSMTQARYSPENCGHFGLALQSYVHFTSPIRRYADLVVHRAIKAVLHRRDAKQSLDWLVATGEQLSLTERRADEVAWGVEGWLKCEHAAERIGETFDGVVMGVTDFGLFVELSGYYVQGLLHISELGKDYFRYEPRAMALVGESSGRRFTLGDKLRVRLVAAAPAQGKLDLVLDGKAPAAGKASRSSRRRGTGRKGGKGVEGGGSGGHRDGPLRKGRRR